MNMEERHCKPSMTTASGFVKMRGHFTVDEFGFLTSTSLMVETGNHSQQIMRTGNFHTGSRRKNRHQKKVSSPPSVQPSGNKSFSKSVFTVK